MSAYDEPDLAAMTPPVSETDSDGYALTHDDGSVSVQPVTTISLMEAAYSLYDEEEEENVVTVIVREEEDDPSAYDLASFYFQDQQPFDSAVVLSQSQSPSGRGAGYVGSASFASDSGYEGQDSSGYDGQSSAYDGHDSTGYPADASGYSTTSESAYEGGNAYGNEALCRSDRSVGQVVQVVSDSDSDSGEEGDVGAGEVRGGGYVGATTAEAQVAGGYVGAAGQMGATALGGYQGATGQAQGAVVGGGYISSSSGGGSEPESSAASLYDSPGTNSSSVPSGYEADIPSLAPSARSGTPQRQAASRQWNEEFQAILTMANVTAQEKLERALRVRKFKQDFELEAVTHARTIIEEMHLPEHRKSITPLDVGGQAGGEKFMASNIFFKFAIDSSSLYGGDEHAMKAASHELVGLRSYYEYISSYGELHGKEVPPLRVGYMVLIDYRGYRLIATCLLPIGKHSLMYGSADAGRNVYTVDDTLNSLMKEAAIQMNIKGHKVGMSEKKFIYGPCDIEAHIGTDGCFYVLDTARVYPPEAPSRSFVALLVPEGACLNPAKAEDAGSAPKITELEVRTHKCVEHLRRILGNDYVSKKTVGCTVHSSGKGGMNECASFVAGSIIVGDAVVVPDGFKSKSLYNLLRPEYVKACEKPLSSDAFTGFGRDGAIIHNTEVRGATRQILDKVIPALCDDLNSRDVIPSDCSDIQEIMKARGINVRYLGVMYHLLNDANVQEMVATLMITRCVKNVIRAQMRQLRSEQVNFQADDQELGFMDAVVRQCNLLLGKSDESEMYWNIVIRLLLLEKFGGYNLALWTDKDSIVAIRSSVSPSALLKMLQVQCGVDFHPGALVEILQRINEPSPILLTHVSAVLPRLKSLQRDEELLTLLTDASASLQERHVLIESVFGISSPEAATSRLEISLSALRDASRQTPATNPDVGTPITPVASDPNALSLARRELEALVAAVNDKPLPEKVAAALWLALGQLQRHFGALQEAKQSLEQAMTVLENCSELLRLEIRFGQRTSAVIDHAFCLRVLSELYAVQMQLNLVSAASKTAEAFAILWEKFGLSETKDRITYLNADTPAPLAHFVSLNGIVNLPHGFERIKSSDAGRDAIVKQLTTDERLLAECFRTNATWRSVSISPTAVSSLPATPLPISTPAVHPAAFENGVPLPMEISQMEALQMKGRVWVEEGDRLIVVLHVSSSNDIASIGMQRLNAVGGKYGKDGCYPPAIEIVPAPVAVDGWVRIQLSATALLSQHGRGLYAFGFARPDGVLPLSRKLTNTIWLPVTASGPSLHFYNLRSQNSSCPPLVLDPIRSILQHRVTKVAVGTFSPRNERAVMAVTESGALFSWGVNSTGVLGHGDTEPRIKPTEVQALRGSQVVDLCLVETTHAFAITAARELLSWGQNRDYQLGHNDKESRLTPRVVKKLEGRRVLQMDTASKVAGVVTEDGAVYIWGGNLHSPTQVEALTGIVSRHLSLTDSLLVVTSEDGQVYVANAYHFSDHLFAEFKQKNFRLDALSRLHQGMSITEHNLRSGDCIVHVTGEENLWVVKAVVSKEAIFALTEEGRLYGAAFCAGALPQHLGVMKMQPLTKGSSDIVRILPGEKGERFLDVHLVGTAVAAVTDKNRLWVWGSFKGKAVILPQCFDYSRSSQKLTSISLSSLDCFSALLTDCATSPITTHAIEAHRKAQRQRERWTLLVLPDKDVVPFMEMEVRWAGPKLALDSTAWLQVVDVQTDSVVHKGSNLKEKEVFDRKVKLTAASPLARPLRVELWTTEHVAGNVKLAEKEVTMREYGDGDAEINIAARLEVVSGDKILPTTAEQEGKEKKSLMLDIDWKVLCPGVEVTNKDELEFFRADTDEKCGSVSFWRNFPKGESRRTEMKHSMEVNVTTSQFYARLHLTRRTHHFFVGKSNVSDLSRWLLPPDLESSLAVDVSVLRPSVKTINITYKAHGFANWPEYNFVGLYDGSLDLSTCLLRSDHIGYASASQEEGVTDMHVTAEALSGKKKVQLVLVAMDELFGRIPVAAAKLELTVEEDSDVVEVDERILALREGFSVTISAEEYEAKPGSQLAVQWHCDQDDVDWGANNFLGIFLVDDLLSARPFGACMTPSASGTGVVYMVSAGVFSLRLMGFNATNPALYGVAAVCEHNVVCDSDEEVLTAAKARRLGSSTPAPPVAIEDVGGESDTQMAVVASSRNEPRSAPCGDSQWEEILTNAGFAPAHVARYAELFEEIEVDAAHASILTRDDLKEVGLQPLGHRIRLLHYLLSVRDEDGDT